MKAVIQTVYDASITVDDAVVGQIDKGLLIYFGVSKNDDISLVEPFFDKILKLRIFKDENDKINLNLNDANASILLVSQFTLETNIYKGNRPSMDSAATGAVALEFYHKAIDYLKSKNINVQTGKFGEHMKVKYINDGPETFILESDVLFKNKK